MIQCEHCDTIYNRQDHLPICPTCYPTDEAYYAAHPEALHPAPITPRYGQAQLLPDHRYAPKATTIIPPRA